MTAVPNPPFGRLLTAMVTPFASDGAVDLDRAAALASYQVDDLQHDGLVVSGTTGESPTTTDAENADLLRLGLGAVGGRASALSGVGPFSTEPPLQLATQAPKLGAHGLLVVPPYYSKPPKVGLLQHFRTVADATDLQMMLFEIPGQAGVASATD